MLEILKTIILDYQEAAYPAGTPRRSDIEPVPGKAAICIGVRRSGKTTTLFQIMQRLIADGVPRQNLLYLNFFDDRLHRLYRDGIGMVADAYYAIYPEKKGTEKVYFFLDEIQMVSGWEGFVDRLLRTELCEVYLTGSSARLLSREIATQMRGRGVSWELFPFSFREFLDFKGIPSQPPFSSRAGLLIRKAFAEFFETGGFPEVLPLERPLRLKIHQEYFHAILFRDIVERHDAPHPQAVRDLAYRLMDNIASLYTLNSLTGYLKERGHKAPKASVAEYLEWFDDAYFLFTVRLFDASASRSNANPKKIYCVDHALVTSVASGILVNSGHLLENLVFSQLRRRYDDIYYYRTRNGREVDFIVLRPDRSRLLVQVCESLADPATRKREVAALREAMAELGPGEATIVTSHEDETIRAGAAVITVAPAWQWLLG